MTTTPHLGLTKDSPTGEKYSVVRVNDNSDRIDEYCYENRTRIVALETAQEQMAGDLADKIEIVDVFGIPKDITASDLDDLTEIGIHQTDDAGAAALAHSPITTGFYLRVFVMELATDTWYRQELVPKNAPSVTYMRHLHVGVGWTAWQHTGILDSTPTENSTNPVTSGGVYPVAVKAVDEGAKNVAGMDKSSFTTLTKDSVTVTLSGAMITTSGTSGTLTNNFFNIFYDPNVLLVPAGTWIASLHGTGTGNFRIEVFDDVAGTVLKGEFGKPLTFTIPENATVSYIRITSKPSTNCVGAFKLMICTTSDWAVSQKFVPYCPTMQELYEMILALQSGGSRSLSVRPAEAPVAEAEPEEKEVETDAGNSDQDQR